MKGVQDSEEPEATKQRQGQKFSPHEKTTKRGQTMRKILVFAVTVSFLGILALEGQAVAKPTHPTFGTFVNAGGVPAGSKLVLNVTCYVDCQPESTRILSVLL